MGLWLVTITAILLICGIGAHAEESCQDMGFAETLLCSGCDKLAQYVKDEQLLSECRKCCLEEAKSDPNQKFAFATLVVCNTCLENYPSLANFIRDRAKKYPNFEVQVCWDISFDHM